MAFNDIVMPGAEVNVPYARNGSASRTNTGVAPYTGTFDKNKLIHLIKRTMFGAAVADVNHFSGMSLADVVDDLLLPGTPPSPPVKNYANTADDTDVAFGQTWINAQINPLVLGDRAVSLKAWWLGQMINQSRSIEEKMVLFWHNHFSTEIGIYDDARFGYKYLNTIRQLSLGNFKALTKAITLEPAMLVYLNGHLNTKGAPDENYSRELQELFTLGKGPNSQYTESDVIEAAKVLTGYDRDYSVPVGYVFNPARHDTSNKTFSSFYNNTVITGRTGPSGEQELDDLIDMIFNQNEVALHICRALYRFFVYYKIDASVETNVIEPLADTFRSNNYNILPVLRQLLMSEHFFDPLNRGCMIKSPMDFIVGFAREWQLKYPDSSQLANQYEMWFITQNVGTGMLQDILDPPSVSGWQAYYQEPIFHRTWINSDTLPKRNQIADFLLYSGLTRNGFNLVLEPIAMAAQFSNPSNPNTLIDDSLQHMYVFDISAGLKLQLKYILLSGQSQDFYWTDAWNAHINDPLDATKRNAVHQRLQLMYRYIMNYAEYQLS
jgi:uncharacterized protein (DUF1800 family)